MQFSPKRNNLWIANNDGARNCYKQHAHFVVPETQFFHMKQLFYIRSEYETAIEMSRQTFIRVNTPNSPCKPTNEVSACEQNCYATKLEQQPLNCKLPFMKTNELPFCLTPETAKTTQKIYLENQMKTNPQKQCSCVARCQETIFNPFITQSILYDSRVLKFKYSIGKIFDK
uniref:Uncharacterized protein n=1 Tax=Strigamia maritima TaxID=126957 RepID=T1JF28_STRMM